MPFFGTPRWKLWNTTMRHHNQRFNPNNMRFNHHNGRFWHHNGVPAWVIQPPQWGIQLAAATMKAENYDYWWDRTGRIDFLGNRSGRSEPFIHEPFVNRTVRCEPEIWTVYLIEPLPWWTWMILGSIISRIPVQIGSSASLTGQEASPSSAFAMSALRQRSLSRYTLSGPLGIREIDVLQKPLFCHRSLHQNRYKPQSTSSSMFIRPSATGFHSWPSHMCSRIHQFSCTMLYYCVIGNLYISRMCLSSRLVSTFRLSLRLRLPSQTYD